ncbi:YHS domain-containing (seleno)protein [Flagellimonas sp.]|uniref:YHS domain-containing (seleno)protein n=1 Tax=Flagellimonas sp. TaxID=2058762 RepID=UPI003B5BC33E
MKKRTKIFLITLSSIVVLVFVFAKAKRISPLSWGHKEVNQPMFSNQAINGYDPVAYFTHNEAVLGNETYTYDWNNAKWNFSSEENKQLFTENPEKYAPQFGGYCAFAISKGFTANSSPDSFELINDKLYLFDNEDVKLSWKENLEENLRVSEENWQ